METLRLPCFGIVITLDGKGGGEINSKFDTPVADNLDNEAFEALGAAFYALESTIFAHACAGIDVQSPAYIKGIKTTFNKIEDFFRPEGYRGADEWRKKWRLN